MRALRRAGLSSPAVASKLASATREATRWLRKLARELASRQWSGCWGLVHGDLDGNVIATPGGDVVLVDWANAGPGDVLEELACVAYYWDLDGDAAAYFLESYARAGLLPSAAEASTATGAYAKLGPLHDLCDALLAWAGRARARLDQSPAAELARRALRRAGQHLPSGVADTLAGAVPTRPGGEKKYPAALIPP
ncbi:MAG: hypothetical protein Kow0069_05710 [Promethearchaeota archaeon]